MEKLQPPEGYKSWLHYAIDTMDTRTLHLDSCDESPWKRIVQSHEFRHEAANELDELETVTRKLWTKQPLTEEQKNWLSPCFIDSR